MNVSKNSGTPTPNHPILIGFSIIFTIHFGVPLFLETPIWKQWELMDPQQKWLVGWFRSPRANAQPVVEDLPMEFPMWLMPARVALTFHEGGRARKLAVSVESLEMYITKTG